MAILNKHRRNLMVDCQAFDETLKYINNLSGHIDVEDTLQRAEVLFLVFRERIGALAKEKLGVDVETGVVSPGGEEELMALAAAGSPEERRKSSAVKKKSSGTLGTGSGTSAQGRKTPEVHVDDFVVVSSGDATASDESNGGLGPRNAASVKERKSKSLLLLSSLQQSLPSLSHSRSYESLAKKLELPELSKEEIWDLMALLEKW
ncbi:GTPase activating protein [Quaeritorhiza haematococci]|nr:GTPase activating protein [Quaeritorhiza haematococci]